jgi:hypothetical protein
MSVRLTDAEQPRFVESQEPCLGRWHALGKMRRNFSDRSIAKGIRAWAAAIWCQSRLIRSRQKRHLDVEAVSTGRQPAMAGWAKVMRICLLTGNQKFDSVLYRGIE